MFFQEPICNCFFCGNLVNIPVVPAPEAFVFDFFASNKNKSSSNPTQLFEAPVSRIKIPYHTIDFAFIKKDAVF
jgi:hypothetical protein